jgi:hypothetical protein
MRTISGTQWQSLEDLSAEGLLGGLSLEQAKANANLRTQYAEKVLPLVYDQQRPS